MSKKEHDTNVDPPVEEKTVESVIGIVTSRSGLNVRLAARPLSNVICEIAYNAEVEVDEENSTDEFYKVCTASGIEGYCMREYITIKR